MTANANASNNTGHITFTNTWGSAASPELNGPSNTVSGNIQITGDTFPADAQTIVSAAGLKAAYAALKTIPDNPADAPVRGRRFATRSGGP